MYILITAANSAGAYRIKSQLNADNIILGDYLALPAFMLNNANMIHLPDPASIAYAHEMLTLCLDKGINTVYALREKELTNLLEAEQLFNEYGIEIVNTK